MQCKFCVLLVVLVILFENSNQARPYKKDASQRVSNCQNHLAYLQRIQVQYKSINESRTREVAIYKKLTTNLWNENKKLETTKEQRERELSNAINGAENNKLKLQNITSEMSGLNEQLQKTEQKLERLKSLEEKYKQAKEELDKAKQNINKDRSQIEELKRLNEELEEFTNYQRNELIKAEQEINDLRAADETNGTYIKAKKVDITQTELLDKTVTDDINRTLNDINKSSKCCSAPDCVQFGSSNDIHLITVPGIDPFEVLCSGTVAGPGWTVIQRRMDGSTNFYRNWADYKKGFGALSEDFFIGLEHLHHMTKAEPQQLYIQMTDIEGKVKEIYFTDFMVASEDEEYELSSLQFNKGNVEDSIMMSVGVKFSTFDRDNDNNEDSSCAELMHGGWWYDDCGLVNLNGRFNKENTDLDLSDSIYWMTTDESWPAGKHSLKSVLMLIKPMKTNI